MPMFWLKLSSFLSLWDDFDPKINKVFLKSWDWQPWVWGGICAYSSTDIWDCVWDDVHAIRNQNSYISFTVYLNKLRMLMIPGHVITKGTGRCSTKAGWEAKPVLGTLFFNLIRLTNLDGLGETKKELVAALLFCCISFFWQFIFVICWKEPFLCIVSFEIFKGFLCKSNVWSIY